MEHRPVRMRRDLRLESLEGNVEPVVDAVPAAELDPAELRMVELVPVDVRVGVLLVRPANQLEVVLDRMLANPVCEVVLTDTGLALRAPELRRPREHAEVFV